MPVFRRQKNRSDDPSDNELYVKGNYGLELCHQDDQAVADVVFVHGLTGDRRSTWTDKHSNVFWPKDLLARDDLPSMRVLSYGYDADVAHFWAMGSQNRIGEHAGNLVNALAHLRNGSDTEGRPIVFIAHSLGGIVTEDAILFSKTSAETYLQDIFNSVSGICFMGTPHCGSDFASWGSVATSLVNTVKTVNKSLVKSLTLNSEILARVQRDFQNEHRRLPSDRAFGITCFYEEIPLRGIGEVVPKHSAILPQYNYIGIHANHMDMVRFTSLQDPGYQAVRGQIRRWLKGIQTRRDAERLPEVVCNVLAGGPASHPPQNRLESTTATHYEPVQSKPYFDNSYPNQNNALQEAAPPSEPTQTYSHTYPNNQPLSPIFNRTVYHNPHTHYDNPVQNCQPHQTSYSQPRAPPHDYGQHYQHQQPSYPQPLTQTHDYSQNSAYSEIAHQHPMGSASGQHQNRFPRQPEFRNPRTYGNTQVYSAEPHPRFEQRAQGSVYQESNHFGQTDNNGGKMMLGNYNVTGNISF
ncbi:hypothetical protein OPT61_g2667 [Boeremia exigua]|uniref:Uncharacterized protein n=1 Tax=Boeremia exigua TaxID=749465 RepID=A0ACC2IKQ0_9PLEO|nr:hypothetical protein OPT61_g2667 [Boeremia exigua]